MAANILIPNPNDASGFTTINIDAAGYAMSHTTGWTLHPSAQDILTLIACVPHNALIQFAYTGTGQE